MAEEERKEKSAQAKESAAEPKRKEQVPAEKKEEQEPAPAQEMVKADIGKRAIAFIIDIAISSLIGLVPVIGGLIAAAYIALRDGFTSEPFVGQSLGKKVLNLRTMVVGTGQTCDYGLSVKRNLPFFIPMVFWVIPFVGTIFGWVLLIVVLVIEALLTVTDENGERIGDKIAGTRVIEIKS